MIARLAIALAGLTWVSFGPSAALAGGARRTLDHDGRERVYLIAAPTTAAERGRVPVVIVLHGGGGHAESAMRMTGFSDKAAAEGFIAVYPNGTSKRFADRLLTWNAGHCCGYAMERGIDDVGFISALIDELVAQGGADPARIYVTGLSNGAMMAHRLGRELPEKIAAIAPVVGGLFGDEERPAAPVAALMINGALDTSIPLEGGKTHGRFARDWDGGGARARRLSGRVLGGGERVRARPAEGNPRPPSHALPV